MKIRLQISWAHLVMYYSHVPVTGAEILWNTLVSSRSLPSSTLRICCVLGFTPFGFLMVSSSFRKLSTTNWHLSSASITSYCSSWPSTSPWREFREESRNEALCTKGENWQNRPSDRYFQKILWVQILASFHIQKSTTITSVTSALAMEERNALEVNTE